MICTLPNCSKEIPPARRQRYPKTKTCSPTCSKEARKAYKAQWMRLYLKKKADLDGDLRWQWVREYEATGRRYEAWKLRGEIEKEVNKAHQELQHRVALGERLYFSPQR